MLSKNIIILITIAILAFLIHWSMPQIAEFVTGSFRFIASMLRVPIALIRALAPILLILLVAYILFRKK